MAELVSQEELDALFSAFGSQGAESGATGRQRSRQAKLYDFTRPDRFSKDQLRTLHMIHSGFARLLSASLSPYLRTPVQVELAGVEQMSYGEYTKSIGDPSVIAIFTLDPLVGSSAFEINPEVGYAMVDRLLGGQGVVTVKPREMTEIDQALLRRVVERALENYAESWAALVHLTPSLKLMASNLLFTQIALRSDMVLMASLETRLGTTTGSMSVCVPVSSLEPILAKLTAHQWFSAGRRGLDGDLANRQQLESHLDTAPLECVVEVGSASVSFGDLADLQPGDLIKLDRPASADLEMKVGNHTRFYGRPGTLGAKLGFSVTRKVAQPWETEEGA